jgi:superfamily I DNA/RNA helicase
VGRERLAGLSADYEHGGRLDEVVAQALERLAELIADSADVFKGLGRFSADHAVRILTIHKSKGLEFDTVIMLAVEKETFWGKLDDERSAYFVGISRAKRRLLLSVAEQRSRPEGFQNRWDELRHRQNEFLDYALTTS